MEIKSALFTEQEVGYALSMLHSPLLRSITEKGAHRLDHIVAFLREHHVPVKIVQLRERTFAVVRFSSTAYSNDYTKILIAHYDCLYNHSGANDNGAACVQLAFFAVFLSQVNVPHNIQIIFTDGEELNAQSISRQGSFLLGLGLRKLSSTKKQIAFVFDVTGCGDTIVISKAGTFSRKSQNASQLQKLQMLYQNAMRIADATHCPYIDLPTAYSDNAGLLATGTLSQLITILPKSEVALYNKTLHQLQQSLNEKDFYHAVQNTIIETGKPKHPILAKSVPRTWQTMHTEHDTVSTLNYEAFASINRFLQQLITYKISLQ
ncbi:MAG: M28 family peptidase [Spirochaetaceae bacterium]|nr:M28 family peptidase [Spirochaetaceae bacterium]